jgi:hypothetical protein
LERSSTIFKAILNRFKSFVIPGRASRFKHIIRVILHVYVVLRIGIIAIEAIGADECSGASRSSLDSGFMIFET